MKEDLVQYWKATGMIKDEKLLQAFLRVPREIFVLPEYAQHAYDDCPLPILKGQTISQPSTVMLMIQALELKPTDVVLEVGSGSGYNAAIMAQLCKEVISTEIIPALAQFAKRNLHAAGITNVTVLQRDGSLGHAAKAPYDKIIITAACRAIPQPLADQLKEHGIILIPIGDSAGQTMIKGVKKKGTLVTYDLGRFAFVPLQGAYA